MDQHSAPPETDATKRDADRPRGGGRPDGRPRRRADAQVGFGDEVERAYCLYAVPHPPPAFPVQHRSGAATRRPTVVARRPGAVLLCGELHHDAHCWPDGEIAEPPTR